MTHHFDQQNLSGFVDLNCYWNYKNVATTILSFVSKIMDKSIVIKEQNNSGNKNGAVVLELML